MEGEGVSLTQESKCTYKFYFISEFWLCNDSSFGWMFVWVWDPRNCMWLHGRTADIKWECSSAQWIQIMQRDPRGRVAIHFPQLLLVLLPPVWEMKLIVCLHMNHLKASEMLFQSNFKFPWKVISQQSFSQSLLYICCALVCFTGKPTVESEREKDAESKFGWVWWRIMYRKLNVSYNKLPGAAGWGGGCKGMAWVESDWMNDDAI